VGGVALVVTLLIVVLVVIAAGLALGATLIAGMSHTSFDRELAEREAERHSRPLGNVVRLPERD